MLGTRDLMRTARFYDAVFAALGEARAWTDATSVSWGRFGAEGGTSFCICLPFDGDPASAGNGVMVALRTSSEAMVRAAHEAALAAGGLDEGEPGPRPQYGIGFFAAYVRDLDGNKLAFAYQAPD